jgi:hypothetical protein
VLRQEAGITCQPVLRFVPVASTTWIRHATPTSSSPHRSAGM